MVYLSIFVAIYDSLFAHFCPSLSQFLPFTLRTTKQCNIFSRPQNSHPVFDGARCKRSRDWKIYITAIGKMVDEIALVNIILQTLLYNGWWKEMTKVS
jgi:hypothetical protein